MERYRLCISCFDRVAFSEGGGGRWCGRALKVLWIGRRMVLSAYLYPLFLDLNLYTSKVYSIFPKQIH